jgi:hypothetical protein
MFSRVLAIILCLGIIAPRVTMTCCCAEVLHGEDCEFGDDKDGDAIPKCPKCRKKSTAVRGCCDSQDQLQHRCDCKQNFESPPPFEPANRIQLNFSDSKLVAILETPSAPANSLASESSRKSVILFQSPPNRSILCVWQC